MKNKIIEILKEYNIKYIVDDFGFINVGDNKNSFVIQLDSEYLVFFDWGGINKELLKPMIKILEVLNGD